MKYKLSFCFINLFNTNPDHLAKVNPYNRYEIPSILRHHILILLFTVVLILAAATQSPGQQPMDIQVKDIEMGSGEVVIEVYNSKSDWLQKPFREVKLSPENKLQTVTFDLPYGNYAISIYQDSNENGELDRNFIGIPKEPIAFGNNHRPFGEPDFESSTITFDASYQPQEIELYKVF